jgi:hypothetical protein
MSSPSLPDLLGLDQIAQFTVLLPTPADPPALLSELQRRGRLTAWQSERLLQGHGHELVLGQYVLRQDGHVLCWDLERKAKRSDTALPENVVWRPWRVTGGTSRPPTRPGPSTSCAWLKFLQKNKRAPPVTTIHFLRTRR